MSPEAAVGLAIETAEVGLARGEMPIGAVVLLGDVVVGRAHTAEAHQKRRIVHADLLAMEAADSLLGLRPRDEQLTLAVNLEPCLMCLGAAITLRVDRICFGLWSPDDGGVALLRHWKPANELSFFKPPREILGGYSSDRIRDQFRRYSVDETRPVGMREWCGSLAAG